MKISLTGSKENIEALSKLVKRKYAAAKIVVRPCQNGGWRVTTWGDDRFYHEVNGMFIAIKDNNG